MGAANSSNPGSNVKGSGPGAQAAAKMEQAMAKCNSALMVLNTSASVLTTKRNKAKTAAVEAFKRKETSEAASLMRKANLAEADLQTIRRRQIAIERQRSMIEQQQLNTMLTGVLVETSAALHTANTTGTPAGETPANALYMACDQLEEVADAQAEIEHSHADFEEVAARSAPSTLFITDERNIASAEAAGVQAEYAAELAQLQILADAPPATPRPPTAPTAPPAEIQTLPKVPSVSPAPPAAITTKPAKPAKPNTAAVNAHLI